jgi:zinc D-Ala-D-Ala carboxypeptidase
MLITKHFTLEEMVVSDYATRNGLKNIPSEKAKENLLLLCKNELEPLRKAVNMPVVVISGFRSTKVNTAIGGATNSQHTKGQAADIIVPGMTVKEVFDIAAEQLEFDQLIDEFGQWTHISCAEKMRNQKLRTEKKEGKTIYIPIA